MGANNPSSELSPVLYITYDGLLDPLGSSQILPYVKGIAAHPRAVHILSFEKRARSESGEAALCTKLSDLGINWTLRTFTSGYGVVGKLWDLLRMYYFGFRTAVRAKSSIVHARGHAAAQVGLFLKRWLGLKLIFDFRGLWVDERVDKGGWDLAKLFHRLQYLYYKRVERNLLRQADHVVVLTEAVIDEVLRLGVPSISKITVIPCCADFDHFVLADHVARKAARRELAIPHDVMVLGYLGSVGGMYLSDRFFRLMEIAAEANPNLHLLALTPDVVRFREEMQQYLPESLHPRAHILSASRDEVAKWLPAIDVLVSFIRPSYARMASSPTKLAESFASGIPAICNTGVGDVTGLLRELDAGVVVDADSDHELVAVSNALPLLIAKGGSRLRKSARQVLGLELAAERYRSVYNKLDSLC